MKDILKMVDEIPGQNFLVDDLHGSHNSYAKRETEQWLNIIIRHIGQQQNYCKCYYHGREPGENGNLQLQRSYITNSDI